MHRLQRLYVDIPAVREGTAGSYLAAAGLVMVAAFIRYVLDPYVIGVQFITFFPAVIITTLVSGWRAGAFSVILSAIAAWFLILHPQMDFGGATLEELVGLALFVTVAAFDVLFIGSLRYAIRRYRDLNSSLESRIEEHSKALVETQRRLAHSEKLQSLGQLTGGLAHDFNNMLAIVMGSLELVKRRRAAKDPQIDPLIDNAMEGARRAAELTKRLLAYARKQPLSPTVVDANKLCEVVAELLRPSLGATISIECVRTAGLWKAFADPAQLENAIVNLAVNARDAMPAGGALTIEVANSYLDDDYAARHTEVKSGQYVAISVTDSGAGMTPEIAARAIEPFFTTKADGKGTGLGLSQVYGFAKQSGGHLAIYSELGKGTTVRLYLPRYHGPADEVHRLAAERLPASPNTGDAVLVVEDDDQVRNMCSAALKDLGYVVHESASAAEALATLKLNPDIPVMLTDVVMPGMNGRELAEHAMKIYPKLRVVYMTGFSRNAIVHNSILDPGVQLLVKPFSVEQLAAKIREIMEANGK
jgi:signal transduction histidine kinase/CheY-like chemotaxis protein